MDTDFKQLQQRIQTAIQSIHEAARQVAIALQPAMDTINTFGRLLILGRHRDESIAHYLERMERKERAHKRYLRRMARR